MDDTGAIPASEAFTKPNPNVPQKDGAKEQIRAYECPDGLENMSNEFALKLGMEDTLQSLELVVEADLAKASLNDTKTIPPPGAFTKSKTNVPRKDGDEEQINGLFQKRCPGQTKYWQNFLEPPGKLN